MLLLSSTDHPSRRPGADPAPFVLHPSMMSGPRLRLVDDLESARLLYEKEYSPARPGGAEAAIPFNLGTLVRSEAYAGNWDQAERLAAQACELAESAHDHEAISFTSASRALLHVYRGRLEDGRRDAHLAVQLSCAIGRPILALFAAESIGLADLSVGDATSAHANLAPYVDVLRTADGDEPALLRFSLDNVEALIRTGERESASALLGPFERRATRLGRGWAVAGSSRCRALLCAAGGDTDAAEGALEEALALHRLLDLPFDRARTLLAAGEVHRRARHRGLAAARLEEALALFQRLGSPLWAARARTELVRLGRGDRAASRAVLTASESHVARLVAVGHTNAQVAVELFISIRTVETHLANIYRKLGLHNRSELRPALADLADL